MDRLCHEFMTGSSGRSGQGVEVVDVLYPGATWLATSDFGQRKFIVTGEEEWRSA